MSKANAPRMVVKIEHETTDVSHTPEEGVFHPYIEFQNCETLAMRDYLFCRHHYHLTEHEADDCGQMLARELVEVVTRWHEAAGGMS